MSRGLRITCAVMTLLFVAWAYFQFNDPDAEPWIALYAASALLAGIAAVERLPRAAPLGLVAFAALWMLFVLFDAFGHAFTAFFEEAEGETWREAFGLAITAAWNGYLAWRLRRGERRRETAVAP